MYHRVFIPTQYVLSSRVAKNVVEIDRRLDVRLDGRSVDLHITSYLSAPNRIITCNAHLGTVYRVFTDLSDKGWQKKAYCIL
jgi:hypothetical protein